MLEYVAAGANRHPATADWYGNILAYGANQNVAIWNPQGSGQGVTKLLVGHTDTVNVVRFLNITNGLLLLTGSVDNTVKIWSQLSSSDEFECIQTLVEHRGSINCVAISPSSPVFATGSADGTLKIWRIASGNNDVSLVQTLEINPRILPLALALSPLDGSPGCFVLAVGGTSSTIQIMVADVTTDRALEFKHKATLSGHEGWIRSLAFTNETDQQGSDLLLSSASQDKYLRLWRIHQGKELPAAAVVGADPAAGAFLPGKSLSNKAHRFMAGHEDYSATFEALLLGHEDWIYSTAWKRIGSSLQLLSASADNSLSIWEQDKKSGVWVTMTRLGEISAQKGSTTATGSTGGFWTGLWSPNGETVVCLGRTGSWRQWNHNMDDDQWVPHFGVGGHVRSVTGIAWSKRGEYLLSTSSDQTTRLHARWKRGPTVTWHEMARPQIHGYDLNCVDSLGENRFVSGADEKLLRVFDEPRAVAKLLENLCGIEPVDLSDRPDAASMPVLGLSNKAIEAADDNGITEQLLERGDASIQNQTIEDSPPLEDYLSRNTLWPEIEKLYGHGYEISALATSHDGSIIATACKASSIDHAVIRLFDTKTWTQTNPPLTAHALTVARLRFSPDDNLLLSVGRDRQWAIFERDGASKNIYTLRYSDPKGHTRMILDAAWAPGLSRAFATAARDKTVKLWAKPQDSVEGYTCMATIKEDNPVTAIDFADSMLDDTRAWLAVGTDTGKVTTYLMNLEHWTVEKTIDLSARYCPSKAVTQLAWQPANAIAGSLENELNLAVASEDCSLRILTPFQ